MDSFLGNWLSFRGDTALAGSNEFLRVQMKLLTRMALRDGSGGFLRVQKEIADASMISLDAPRTLRLRSLAHMATEDRPPNAGLQARHWRACGSRRVTAEGGVVKNGR
jgi:hypothetical protein